MKLLERLFKMTLSGMATLALPSIYADTTYDWLAGTHWYVPAANVLAYATSGTDLSNPLPIGDQTLWDITSSVNGIFSGTTSATLKIGSTTSTSDSTMSGIATPDGQIRIIFTPDGGGVQTVGIGQFRTIGGESFMEMQMMTGTGTPYVTHWAYMALAPDGTFVPPAPDPEIDLLSQEWAWMDGTTWDLEAPGLLDGAATFTIAGYRNGYFWGPGEGTDGEFTQIGSVTPEGNVLFNFLVDGVLTNLTGQISGTGADGKMILREYQGTDTFGPEAMASVVPEPSVVGLIVAAVLLGMAGTWRQGLRKDSKTN